MLLTGDLYKRGINVLVEKFSKKKPELFSTKRTIKKTVKTTDGMIFAVFVLLIFIMEIYLIIFLLSRTISEIKPGANRNVRLILIFLIPELYALGYFFVKNKNKNQNNNNNTYN
jgi:hypothetical protein